MTAKTRLIRNIIIAVLAIAILGGGYYFALKWEPEKVKETETAEEEAAIQYVVSENVSEVKSISIKNAEEEYDIVRDPEGEGVAAYYIPGLTGDDVNYTQIGSTFSALARMSATKVVSADMERISEFGLNLPTASYTINKIDGSTVKVLIGDEVPTGEEYYCMVENGGTIYTISAYKAGRVLAESNSYRKKVLLNLTDATEIKSFSLYKNNQPVMKVRETSQEEQAASITGGIWALEYPWEDDLDCIKLGEALKGVLVIEATGFGNAEDAPELDYRLELTTESGVYDFRIGGKTEDGGVYLQSKEILYTVDPAVRDTVESLVPNNFVNKLVALANISEVSKITLKKDEIEYTMEPGNTEGKPYIICGEQVEENEFKKEYQTVIGITFTERVEVSADGKPYMTVTYNYTDGRTEEIKYYEYDEREMLAVRPNGTTVKVLSTEVKKLTELISK